MQENVKSVVINKCFGGFGLSRAAFLRLRELGCEVALKEPDFGEPWEEGGRVRESWINSFCTDIPRDNPQLVQVIGEMGEAADGPSAELKIVEIPSDVEWEIEEYDGAEHVAEKHRTWG